jgi:Cof subfamily protein (haloacid dehalogenase superfamily)
VRSIKLVAIDIDGTLATDDGQIVTANRDAIARATREGTVVILVTGRWLRTALPFAQRIGLTTPVVCCNGAVAYTATGEVLWQLDMPLESARTVAAYADDHDIELSVTIDDRSYFRRRSRQADIVEPGWHVVDRNLDAVTAPPVRMLAVGHDATRTLLAGLQDRLRESIRFLPTRRGARFDSVGIHHKDVSKGDAVRRMCEYFQIAPEHTMAIGDNDNDVEMFAAAGISVAVADAPPEVRAAARVVGPRCDEGVVAWALDHYVLRGH